MKIRHILLASLMLLGSLTAVAQLPFILHRYDAFKALKVSNQTVALIGNSITNMGHWHEQFGDNSLVVNRGVSSACSYQALENLESILIGQPAKLFVTVGTNDIGTNTGNAATISRNAEALIERVKHESPNTQTYIISIFPSSAGLRTPQNLKEVNDSLKVVCEKTGTPYIDLWDTLQGILDNSISTDRLHLITKGYYLWSKALLPYLGEGFKVSLPAETDALNWYDWAGSNSVWVNNLSSLPFNSEDILMLGGEMFNNGEWHELLHNPHIKNRAVKNNYGDWQTSMWLNLVERIFDVNEQLKKAPAQIFLNIGSQDLADGVAEATLQANYRTIVEKLQTKYPETTVRLVAITPHRNANQNNKIKAFNSFLEKYAEELKLEYVDVFTPIANADGSANPTYVDGSSFITAHGYHAIAKTLARYIENSKVEPTEEFEQRYEMINARQALGNVITRSYVVDGGSTTGTYRIDAVNALREKRADMYAMLNKPDATPEQILAMAEELDSPLPLNQPVSGKYYHIVTVRGNRIVNVDGINGLCSTPENNVDMHRDNTQWQLVKRADDTWNIINRKDGLYLTPDITVSADEPKQGWRFGDATREGKYVLISGTNVQLNELGTGTLINWGFNSPPSPNDFNYADEGCCFSLIELPDDYEHYSPENTVTTTIPLGYDEKNRFTYKVTCKRDDQPLAEGVTKNWVYAGGVNTLWRLYEREDGDFNIQNTVTNNYLNPENTHVNYNQFLTTADIPAKGWKLVPEGDYYLIISDKVQLNMMTKAYEYRFINWGYGINGSTSYTTNDDGCLFRFYGEGTVSETPVERITLNKTEITLIEGETEQLDAVVSPTDATDQSVLWSSDNESVATVADGLVTAIASGSATITAVCGGKQATCIVTVNDIHTSIDEIRDDNDVVRYYDMSGRRLLHAPKRGLYFSISSSSAKLHLAK